MLVHQAGLLEEKPLNRAAINGHCLSSSSIATARGALHSHRTSDPPPSPLSERHCSCQAREPCVNSLSAVLNPFPRAGNSDFERFLMAQASSLRNAFGAKRHSARDPPRSSPFIFVLNRAITFAT